MEEFETYKNEEGERVILLGSVPREEIEIRQMHKMEHMKKMVKQIKEILLKIREMNKRCRD